MKRELAPIESCLRCATTNTASVLKLAGKGELREGADADIAVVDRSTWKLRHVVAGGKTMMRDGVVVVTETSMANTRRHIELHGKKNG